MAAPPELADIADIARAASVATLMDSKGREGTFPRSAARASDDAGDAALVDREEAARWLGVSVRTVTRLANDGRLTKVQLRGAVRYRLDELVELATAGSS
jgi:excisionase family DNA binding protein